MTRKLLFDLHFARDLLITGKMSLCTCTAYLIAKINHIRKCYLHISKKKKMKVYCIFIYFNIFGILSVNPF